jgi:predicted lipoprotein with Yx(FWY)xxD motif
VIPLTALAVGCGGGSGGGSGNASASPAPAKTTSARSATVHVTNSRLGKILVDSNGRTLYLFKKDAGSKSACFGACATFWPPLRASGRPTVGRGAHASMVGTTRRSDGKPQVTYNGHPLYRFAKDAKPGEINGEGVTAFGGSWFAVSPAGNRVSPPSKAGAGSRAPAPAPKASPPPAAPPAPKASPPPAAPPAPKASPPSHSNGVPQNGGGDDDGDNNGGPDDGDGGV